MKAYIFILIGLFYFSSAERHLFQPDEIFPYFEKMTLTTEKKKAILESFTKIVQNSYAFNDIAKNPPQPYTNYHTKVDIQERLKKIDVTKLNAYELYQSISNALSDLKDPHIRIFFKDFDFTDFMILGPFQYEIKEYQGKQRLFAKCLNEYYLESFKLDGKVDDKLKEYCKKNNNNIPYPIKSINDLDPFEYINNFGGNFLASKNIHGTFSNKLSFHNYVSLNDYPLTLEQLNKLTVVLDDPGSTTFKTTYIVEKEAEAQYSPNPSLRVLNILNEKKEKKSKNNLRKLATEITWSYKYAEEDGDLLKCYCDEDNKINVYSVSSFEPKDKDGYKQVLQECVTLFDSNKYPIVVFNELNTGGYMSLTQIFLGVLSPLIPINLFKGRIRIPNDFDDLDEVKKYISSNLTSITTCRKASYEELTSNKEKPSYSDTYLTQAFYVTNISIHNEIERMRLAMKNKRKPHEIVVLTNGYAFSTAALYIKYLQKAGGAIVVGYKGNPNKKDSVFDSGQCPSGVFTSGILQIFNKKEYQTLAANNIELEFPGVQIFYDLKEKDVPLEYEVNPIDQRINIYRDFEESTYTSFIDKVKDILSKTSTNCYSNKMVKFDEKCDQQFTTKYTHGGYSCKNGAWTDKCVAAYCDLGYSFDEKKKKCVKDICTSLDVKVDPNDEGNVDPNDPDDGTITNSSPIYYGKLILMNLALLFYLL